MEINEYPYNNEHILEGLTEVSRVVEVSIFYLGDHELKIEVTEDVRTPRRYHYNLYERKVISRQNDENIESWVFVTHFPFDVADSASEALAAALRWIKDYFPKLKK